MKRARLGSLRTPFEIREPAVTTDQAGVTSSVFTTVFSGRGSVKHYKPDAPRDGGTAANLDHTKLKVTVRMKPSMLSRIVSKMQLVARGLIYEIQTILPGDYMDTVVLHCSLIGGGTQPVREGMVLALNAGLTHIFVDSEGNELTWQ